MKQKIPSLLLTALLLTGCGASETELITAAEPDAAVGITALSETAAAPDAGFLVREYGFSLDLLRRTLQSKPGENVMLSPYSVMQALGMTANGAAGQTRTEMETLLIGSGRTVDDLNAALCSWRTGRPEEQGSCKLHAANGIWINGSEQYVKESFLEQNRKFYDAAVHSVPFDNAALKEINNFVKKETDGMVPVILETLDPAAEMVLVNAVSFEAAWQLPYQANQIENDKFTNADGSKQSVPMMTGTENDYLEQNGAVGFLKYYDGQYAFAGILPPKKVSVQEWLSQQSAESLCAMIAGRTDEPVLATIPQFSADTSMQLENILPDMGMPTAFSGEADFSGINDHRLIIDEVVHKTHIDVDAQGTKAAAATAVVLTKEIGETDTSKLKTVRLDRPFVYMILDMTNELPVFIGTVNTLS